MKLIQYTNQVTGHDCLLTTEDYASICKVKHGRELEFYRDVDESLRPHLPLFQGVVDVTVSVDEDGKYDFNGHFENGRKNGFITASSDISKRAFQNDYKYRNLEPSQLEEDPNFKRNFFTNDFSKGLPAPPCDVGRNPWAERVQRMGRHTKHKGKTITYIILENLTKKFEKPCILDMKTGTQLYAKSECTQEKFSHRERKNRTTTTAAIGLRLSGFQVYQDGGFVCRDKFYGRGLTPKGLEDSVRLFFTGKNNALRRKMINNVIEKVQINISVLSNLHGYRFFGSSIVVVYEGHDADVIHVNDKSPRTDVRLVDFAHCRTEAFDDDEAKTVGPDKGFIYGLSSFIQILKNIQIQQSESGTQINNSDCCSKNWSTD
uniref:inositol hexakisphosphate kinase 2-like n=1 Tax=Styela clava TaxID=7725 RepID=UPI0019392F8D|nr:inositol hexakisphosphate kinase 2-like [Styela clava]